MGTGALVTAGQVTDVIATYGSVISMIISTVLILAALFIFKGGFHWVLSALKSAITFGGR